MVKCDQGTAEKGGGSGGGESGLPFEKVVRGNRDVGSWRSIRGQEQIS